MQCKWRVTLLCIEIYSFTLFALHIASSEKQFHRLRCIYDYLAEIALLIFF